jgi:hypothetical protein
MTVGGQQCSSYTSAQAEHGNSSAGSFGHFALDPVTEGDGILCFFAESPETYPARQSLLEAAMNWVRTAGEDRVGFYTVEEELAASRAPPKVSSPARNKLAKKVTNAVLAEQVTAIVETLPAVFEQLFTLQASQEGGSMMSSSNMRPKVLRYRQSFLAVPPRASLPAASTFLQAVGPPPKAKVRGGVQMQDQGIEENISGEEPYVFCCEEGFQDQLNAALQDSLARAVFNNLCCANPRP